MRKEKINHTNQDSVIPAPETPGASRRDFFGKFGAATAVGLTTGGFAARLSGAPTAYPITRLAKSINLLISNFSMHARRKQRRLLKICR